MENSKRSRAFYSVGEAIRLQRETLRFCSAMFGEAYLAADSRESLRREIARVLQITVAVTSDIAKELLDTPIVPLCVKKRQPIDPDATCYCWDCLPSAIADTHPKGGDSEAAPSLMSGGGAEGNRPTSSPNTVRQQREGKR